MQFTSVGLKDTLRNVRETGEFVICLTPASLITEVNLTATNFPPDVSEFDAVGLEREPSVTVAPFRVAASPFALECSLERTVDFGDSVVVMGRVLHAAVAADAFVDGHVVEPALEPVGRLGGNNWVHPGPVEAMARLRYEEWLGQNA